MTVSARGHPEGGGGHEADAEPPAQDVLRRTLFSRGYLRLLLLCVVLGVPIALTAFFFVSLQHWFQHEAWDNLPKAVGYHRAPWWWPMPALLLAGLLIAPIVTRMPGRGGHVPVHGLGGPPIGPRELPGVVLAALATLPLGVVLGPEAPLMALGTGLGLFAIRRVPRGEGGRSAAEPDAPRPGAEPNAPPGTHSGTAPGRDPRAEAVIATAGATAAIATILGGPVAAAVMLIEAAGLAGPQLVVLLLPALTASATGALVFTGFGRWTDLATGALALPNLPPDVDVDAGDFLWGLPAAALVAAVVGTAHHLGRTTEAWTRERTAARTVLCAAAVGGCVTAYALITGRNPEEAALSGQMALDQLAAHPHALSVGALVALVACKGVAWGISLGSLRGGPIFPAVLLGAATAMACSGLPGLGPTPALALGISAAAAVVTGLPLTSAVLAVLLMGKDASAQMPLMVLAAVVGFVVSRVPVPVPVPRPGGEARQAA